MGVDVPTVLSNATFFPGPIIPYLGNKVHALVKLVIRTTSDMPLVTPELNLTGDARVTSEKSMLRDHPHTGAVISLKAEFPPHGSSRTVTPGTANSFSHCAGLHRQLHRQHGDPNVPSFE